MRENSKCLWKIRELEKTGFLAAQYAEKAHAYAARHGAPGAEALLEVAKLGEEGLEKLRREQEKLERLNGLRELAKPEEKEKLLARKSEIERAISLF